MATANELYRQLQEAANTGEWLESRLHLMFTEIADNMFGEGYLSREERISLSSAIGAALDAFRGEVEAKSAQLYQRGRWQEPQPTSSPAPVQESGEYQAMFVPLLEKAVRRDGSIPLKIIQPGWGSSGYYPAAVLERDGPSVFKSGTQMFWNHQTGAEEVERPEGDLNDLAAVLIGDARWEASGVAGPGLYAEAKVFEAYQKAVDDLAPHIGVSIRASGRAQQGEAEGQKGPIIQQIVAGKSIDFVTKPGAGGQIVQMFEAARSGQRMQPVQEEKVNMTEVEKQLKEAQDRLAQVEQQNARLQEALLRSQAADIVAAELRRCSLPDVTKVRLADSLAGNPPIKDGAIDQTAYATQIAEAVKAESEYLASVAGLGSGRILGMGPSNGQGQQDEVALQKRLAAGFTGLGLSEAETKHAVAGRG